MGLVEVDGREEKGERSLMAAASGVGGCGYCGLWRGVRGSAATRAPRCSVGMARAAAA